MDEDESKEQELMVKVLLLWPQTTITTYYVSVFPCKYFPSQYLTRLAKRSRQCVPMKQIKCQSFFFTNLQSIPAPPKILQIHFQHLWSWQSCLIHFYWAIKTLLAKTNQKNVLNLICMCARLFLEWMTVRTHPRQFNVWSIYCSSCRKQNKS